MPKRLQIWIGVSIVPDIKYLQDTKSNLQCNVHDTV